MNIQNEKKKIEVIVVPELLKIKTQSFLASNFCYHTFNHFANHLVDILNNTNYTKTRLSGEFDVVKDIKRPDDWNRYGLYLVNPEANKIYFERKLLGNTIKLLYEDEGDTFRLTCNKKYYNWIRFTIGGGLFPPGLILQNIVTVKLLERSYVPIHCAAISKDGEAIILPAPPDTGKTITVLSALETGFNFVSEEVAVVDSKRNIYSCPLTATYAKYLSGRRDRLYSAIAEKIPIFPFFVKQPTSNIINFLRKIKIDKKAKIGYIVLLERGESEVLEANKDVVLQKVLAMNRAEFPFYHDPLLSAYSYFNTTLDLHKIVIREKKIISSIVDEVKCFVIKSKNPKEYINLLIDVLKI